MLRQPFWDKFETALLIEAYWIIKADSSKKKVVVASLSSALRKRATFDVDETFRNQNGINLRLSELDYLFTEGAKGVKNTSDLFREMVEMYLHDRDQFEMVLSEAKSMSVCTNDTRTCFCKWLQDNSPKTKTEYTCKMLEIGEKFCKNTRVLRTPLFETTDVETVRSFVKTVTQNKIFRIRNKKHHSEIVNAANLYYSFVRNLPKLSLKDDEEELVPQDKADYQNSDDNATRMDGTAESIGNEGYLHTFVESLLNEYISAQCEPFAGHPIGRFVREQIPKMIYDTGIVDPKNYLVKGSVGQGTWAMVPWVCIFDRSITVTAYSLSS